MRDRLLTTLSRHRFALSVEAAYILDTASTSCVVVGACAILGTGIRVKDGGSATPTSATTTTTSVATSDQQFAGPASQRFSNPFIEDPLDPKQP